MKETLKQHKCTYTTGGGSEHSDGIWIKKCTPKTTTMEKIKEDKQVGVYAMHKIGFKVRVGVGTGNPIRDYEDDTFTIYFQQAGTPYYFEPIK